MSKNSWLTKEPSAYVADQSVWNKTKGKEGSDCVKGKVPTSGICAYLNYLEQSVSKAPPSAGPTPSPAEDDSEPVSAEDEVRKLVVDNPQMSASTFINTLKAKGIGFIDQKQDLVPSTDKEVDEADAASGHVAVLRGKPKEANYTLRGDEGGFGVTFRCKITEGSAKDNGVGFTKFRAILIQEGLGNLRDLYYYTKEALASAVPLFEGKKIYADHPSRMEEQDRPERSVRDIIGYFENVALEEGEDGRAMLAADVVTLPDDPFRWARALIRESVDFAKKYPDKDFVGLSINASGDAEPQEIQDFVKESKIPTSIVPKLQKAIESGAQSIKLVSKLTEAVSCDLVTEAGAGGRVLSLLEQEKSIMKQKKEGHKHEDEAFPPKAKPAPDADGDGDSDAAAKKAAPAKDKEEDEAEAQEDGDQDASDSDHADEEKDKELIKKMLAQYLGDDDAENEEIQKHAHEAYQAHKEMGKKEDEAMKAAMEAMKLAKHMAAKHAEKKQAESIAIPGGSEKKESIDLPGGGGKKESAHAAIARLTGENARLKEALRKYKLSEYLEKKMKESRLPVKVTEQFREAIGLPKSEAEIDRAWVSFKKGFEANTAREAEETENFFVMTEKQSKPEVSRTEKVNFSDFTS